MIHKIRIPPKQRREFECAECRRLLAAGIAEREDFVEFYRGEMKCLSGNVDWFADRTVKDGHDGTPRFVKHDASASPTAKNQSEAE